MRNKISSSACRILLFWIFFHPSALLFSSERAARELVDEANKLLRGQSSHSKISMRITTPKWKRTLEIEAWNYGREKSLMRIHSPAKERGNVTLKIGKELWNWLPSVERVIKIPPSMMHASWMGSDFTYEDVVKADSIVKDYDHKVVEKSSDGGRVRYLIEALPKRDAPVVWGKILFSVAVENDAVIPVKEEDYSERGEHIRTLIFSEIKTMGVKRIPTKIECVPLKKNGHKTTIFYRLFESDLTFEPNFFGLRRLQEPLK